MSHVTTIEMEIQDLQALKAAAEELGLEFVENQHTYRWYGRHVGDYPLPTGFKKEDMGKCEHAIRIPKNKQAYEIGVVTRRDGRPGYTLMWDFFAGGYGMEAKVGEGGKKLIQEYSVQQTRRHWTKKGCTGIRLETKGADKISHIQIPDSMLQKLN